MTASFAYRCWVDELSRSLLQITNGLLGILTIFLAGASLAFGIENPIYAGADLPLNAALDSNLRFMGGMGIGLGLALLWILPTIEKRTELYRLIWICALLGGVGRLFSIGLVGSPPLPIVVFTLIEVPGVPLLIYWQYKVAKSTASAGSSLNWNGS